jgi:hypothetical protein
MINPVGYFKVYRELFTKSIWTNSTSKQKTILITLIAMADWKEGDWEWQGVRYKTLPGQFITSLESIAKTSGKDITSQNVRTCLLRLENMGFLTNKSTNKNRLITINNWALYQEDVIKSNKHINKQLTSNQQATNKQLTTKEEYKKEISKEDKNICILGSQKNIKLTDEELQVLKKDYPKEIDDAIEFLSLYIADKGDKSKSKTHNLTIRRWVIDAVKEKKQKTVPFAKKSNVGNFEQRNYSDDYLESMFTDVTRLKEE